jgi:hypothetical protein
LPQYYLTALPHCDRSVTELQVSNLRRPIVIRASILFSPGTTRGTIGGSAGGSISFNPVMRRKRKAYEAETKKSQQSLSVLARDTGGQIFLPKSEDNMLSQGDQVARDIGAECVFTYRPKKGPADAAPGEYRRIEIAPSRQGLTLRIMHEYVAKPVA